MWGYDDTTECICYKMKVIWYITVLYSTALNSATIKKIPSLIFDNLFIFHPIFMSFPLFEDPSIVWAEVVLIVCEFFVKLILYTVNQGPSGKI